MSKHKHNQEIYTFLAPVYDEVMREIDYNEWADFIDSVIMQHRDESLTILELACGTGSFALSLDELDCYDITATDISEEMLEIARGKSDFKESLVGWNHLDFNNINLSEKFDVILLLFDSINYLTDNNQILNLYQQVKKVLKEGGIFIFDFVTPKNSQKHSTLMNDEGVTSDNWRYIRTSRYLEAENLHYNDFEIFKLSNDKNDILSRHREIHVQKVYTLQEMIDLNEQSGFELVATYDEFNQYEASSNSNRITFVTTLK